MLFSKATSYGMRALAYLASRASSQPCGLREIAEAADIPPQYLGKLLGELRRHRLIRSTKGIHGGYALALPSADISLWRVFRVLDASPDLDDCLLHCTPCRADNTCPLHNEWQGIRNQLVHMLEQRTIAELAAQTWGQPHGQENQSKQS